MTPRLLCASDVRAHSSLSLPGSHGLGPWSLCCTLIISRHATFANIPYRRRTLAWTFLFLPSCYPCQEAEPLSLFTFPVVACTAGPSCQPNPPPDLLPQLLCLVVLTAAPLRCAPPWPPNLSSWFDTPVTRCGGGVSKDCLCNPGRAAWGRIPCSGAQRGGGGQSGMFRQRPCTTAAEASAEGFGRSGPARPG